MTHRVIRVRTLTQSAMCLGDMRAQRVFVALSEALRSDCDVILDFTGVERISVTFLNTAVGPIYRDFPISTIKARMRPPLATDDILAKLKLVTDNAKRHYRINETDHAQI